MLRIFSACLDDMVPGKNLGIFVVRWTPLNPPISAIANRNAGNPWRVAGD
jgi:hypothetical protein